MTYRSPISGIYKITINKAFYYGSSKNLRKRHLEHVRVLNEGNHHNPRVQRAWNKHGEMIWEIVEECPPNDLTKIEQGYLDAWFGHPDCMNVALTANSCLGRILSQETKDKISRGNKGKVRTKEMRAATSAALSIANQRPEVKEARVRGQQNRPPVSVESREKMSRAALGRVFTDEHRSNISKAKKGWVMSQEQRDQISLNLAGFKHTPETRERMRTAQTGHAVSPEVREKLRLANTGRQVSPETRLKQSLSAKRRHERQRADKKGAQDAGT